MGAFGEAFGYFFGHLGVSGLVLDGTPSAAKTYIFRFMDSQIGILSSTSPGVDFRVFF